MIIILSEERMMETMIPPQVGMRLRTLKRKKKKKKKRKKRKKKGQIKKWPIKKGRPKKGPKIKIYIKRGQRYYLFTTLVLQSSTTIFIVESLSCYHFHILVGILHYRTWLVYSNDGFPQKFPQVFVSKQVGCTPTQFLFELSYTYSSSASVAWQSLLTHIDIY